METIFITGATGTLATEIIRQLAEKPVKVLGGSRQPKPDTTYEVVEFDYARPETFTSFKRADRVVMIPRPVDMEADQVMIPAIEAAKASGVKQIVLITGMGINHIPQAPLFLVEQALITSGVDYTIVRPSFFYDNFTKADAQTIAIGKLYAPAGDGRINFISAKDVAAVSVAALLNPQNANKAFDITGSEAPNYSEVAKELSTALGKPVAYKNISEEQFAQGLKAAGFADTAIAFFQQVYVSVRAGQNAALTNDVEAATGSKPEGLKEFISRNIQAWA
ncbi:NAD(P)H-binding protein [Pseudovibrio sp. JE062]|uniref:NAD(P)H-binding protein n=1 Tax=Pseudovibrio sp. JE062 TaxID=439495 RepID=UPI000186BBDD|nr:NAD(P)H-binding protein [Pseudovibrio sp. JE062]EEA93891.1 NmrA-like family protein [Pseudovibrio sp. JE062]